MTEVLRYAAFTRDPAGGNPAGVVLDATGLSDAAMQRIAAEVGYSETAFLTAGHGSTMAARYFAPALEVPFCGHATIAAAVALAERHGPREHTFVTRGGDVTVRTRTDGHGLAATFTSVPPSVSDVSAPDLSEAVGALGWRLDELDDTLPARVACAGGRHLVVSATTRERLADLRYDFPRLHALCERRQWNTLALIHREAPLVYHVRNPFPLGGVVEDPATGSAAAALGGYLRALALVETPSRITIHQGVDMGRPSVLAVDIPRGDDGVSVTGYAVPMSGRTS